jgi:hypothetical protein
LSPTGIGGVVAWQTATAPHGVLACPSEGTRWRTGYAALIDRHWARASAELLHHVLGLDCRIEAMAIAPGHPEPTIASDEQRRRSARLLALDERSRLGPLARWPLTSEWTTEGSRTPAQAGPPGSRGSASARRADEGRPDAWIGAVGASLPRCHGRRSGTGCDRAPADAARHPWRASVGAQPGCQDVARRGARRRGRRAAIHLVLSYREHGARRGFRTGDRRRWASRRRRTA